MHEIGVFTHPVAGLHVSVVHWLLSLHEIGGLLQPLTSVVDAGN